LFINLLVTTAAGWQLKQQHKRQQLSSYPLWVATYCGGNGANLPVKLKDRKDLWRAQKNANSGEILKICIVRAPAARSMRIWSVPVRCFTNARGGTEL